MPEPRLPLQSPDAAPHRRRLGTLSPVYGGPAESGIAAEEPKRGPGKADAGNDR